MNEAAAQTPGRRRLDPVPAGCPCRLTIEGISSGCTLVFLISTQGSTPPRSWLGGPSTTVFAEKPSPGSFTSPGDQWPDRGGLFATIMFMAALIHHHGFPEA